MPLKKLDLGLFMGDISSLRGMHLQELHLNCFRGGDISPLRGMPLHVLSIGVSIGGIRVLRGMPLKRLVYGMVQYKAEDGSLQKFLDAIV